MTADNSDNGNPLIVALKLVFGPLVRTTSQLPHILAYGSAVVIAILTIILLGAIVPDNLVWLLGIVVVTCLVAFVITDLYSRPPRGKTTHSKDADGEAEQEKIPVAIASRALEPMPASEIQERYMARASVDYAIRLIPKPDFSEKGLLGKEERAYVFVGDYAEQRYRSLREILKNLWIGDAFDRVEKANEEWVAVVFEVGELNRLKLDLKPATWKAIFRILSDPRRLGLLTATRQEEIEMGPGRERDYYSGDQFKWQDRITLAGRGFEGMLGETLLEKYFGLSQLCVVRGEGITGGAVPSRLFLVKNVALCGLSYRKFEMGSLDDQIILS